jgi:hypothetical protein
LIEFFGYSRLGHLTIDKHKVCFYKLIILGGRCMDKYTKIVLSVIAICLIAIVIKLWEPRSAYSGFMDKGPTIGDMMNLSNLKGENHKKEWEKLIKRIPVVNVYGTVDVSGSVACD